MDAGFTRPYSGLAVIAVLDFLNGIPGGDAETIVRRMSENASRAIELAPDDPRVLQVCAVAAPVRKDLPTALATINKAADLHPNDAGVLFTRGEITVCSGRPQDAISDIERASRLDPGYTQQHL